jgi:hypothetical protein
MAAVWPFLGRHLDMVFGVLAVALWGGSLGWFVRNDIRKAWRDYQDRRR